MGSIVAQDVFQRKLDAIFLSIPGVTGIADDMIIYGRNDQEHDAHLVNFLEVCRKNTLTSTSFLLWTPMECKESQPRSKEDCCSEKDGASTGYGNNEKFPWTC